MTTSLVNHRLDVDEVRGFQAPPALTAALQQVLVDLIELHLQAKQAHWNLVGTNFRDLHLQLDEIVDIAREAADTMAERLRAVAAVPDGRSDTVVSTTRVPALAEGLLSTAAVVDAVTTRIRAVVGTMRRVHDGVDDADPSTADLLHAVIDSLEKQAWMLGAERG